MDKRKETQFVVKFEGAELTDEQTKTIDEAIRSAVAQSITRLGLPQVLRPLKPEGLGPSGGQLSGLVAVDPTA
ncbi:hypothetical protein GCM10012320_18630 [Sinomonas cellulolyticus]|jgi:hypothetical protein|uniref:Uncharacterized protein n=1 Tax=Sinomonas cellulolyticus TaxID=2801916 RepID=A0ABS1K7F5_9MICC|nr:MULTISPECIES: hypothetical protein [Sinomonas]MBL0707242.1 hypothetical protein [Sinomonas cellulolyticus]GHG50215.1 hypothetical protein GCM10012320_18630 [Sinomonas sp. KCTC 49339]